MYILRCYYSQPTRIAVILLALAAEHTWLRDKAGFITEMPDFSAIKIMACLAGYFSQSLNITLDGLGNLVFAAVMFK